MSPSWRHDQRHVADMSLTQHTMSANEGLGRHDKLRHSLLRLAPIDIIPGCMTTAFWKEQYAQTLPCHTTAALMSDIKMNYTPDDRLCCMPEVLAPKKSGHPRKMPVVRLSWIILHLAKNARGRRKCSAQFVNKSKQQKRTGTTTTMTSRMRTFTSSLL
jgi:hypothetical protein